MPELMAHHTPDDDDIDDDEDLDAAYLLRNWPSTKPPAKKTKMGQA